MKCSYRCKPAAREKCLIILSTAFGSFLSRKFVLSFQGCHHTEVLVSFTGSLTVKILELNQLTGLHI